jgi:hypothetical protein
MGAQMASEEHTVVQITKFYFFFFFFNRSVCNREHEKTTKKFKI